MAPFSSTIPLRTRVLALSSTAKTIRLFESIREEFDYEALGIPEAEAYSALQVDIHKFEFAAVGTAAQHLHQGSAFGVAVVDVQPGAEEMAEQLIGALYQADPALQILALAAPDARPRREMVEVLTHNARMGLLKLPHEAWELRQMVSVMAQKWLAERELERMQLRAANPPTPVASSGKDESRTMMLEHEVQAEAIGVLATGIAHEFNNVLTVIQNQMAMALTKAADLPEVAELLNQMMDTASQASCLSQKLLALNANSAGECVTLNLAELVDGEVTLLRKTLGDDLTLDVSHAPDLPPILGDTGTVAKVIINTAVHARGAMPMGGELRFATQLISVETGNKHARAFPATKRGDYAMLTIEDPEPTRDDDGVNSAHLPASNLQGERLDWIRQTMEGFGGAFSTTLIPGMVRLYQLLFPLAKTDIAAEAPKTPPLEALPQPAAPATILVVDDDETICLVMTQVLGTLKHHVLTARTADEGWHQWRQHRNTIKLLITDINMPGGANGVALGQAVQEDDATVPVIYSSGYRATGQFADLVVGDNYLPKPFGMNDLIKVVAKNLAGYRRQGLHA